MTNRYSHLSDDTLKQAISKLDVTKWSHSREREAEVICEPFDFIGGPNGNRTRVLALRGIFGQLLQMGLQLGFGLNTLILYSFLKFLIFCLIAYILGIPIFSVTFWSQ
jgi:hypothetical protein